jgi:hypothetical protein
VCGRAWQPKPRIAAKELQHRESDSLPQSAPVVGVACMARIFSRINHKTSNTSNVAKLMAMGREHEDQ